MNNVKCDYCDRPAVSFDSQHLCHIHSQIRDQIRKRQAEINRLKIQLKK